MKIQITNVIDAASITIRQMPAAAQSQVALNSFGYGFFDGCKNGKYNFAVVACSNLAHSGAEVLPRRAFTAEAIYRIAESLVGAPVQIAHTVGAIAVIDRTAVIRLDRPHFSHITNSTCGDINAAQTARDGYLRVIAQCSGVMAIQQYDMSNLGASIGFDYGGAVAGKASKGGYARVAATKAHELSLVTHASIPDCGVLTPKIEGELLRGYGYG